MDGTAHTLLLLSLMTASVACGPSITVYPLANEDPEISQKYTYRPTLDEDAADVKALAAFYRACLEGDTERVWATLSAPTRELLDNLGKVRDLTGRDLLAQGQWPSRTDNRATVKASALQVCCFDGDLAFEREPDHAADAFLAIDRTNRAKAIRFVHEDGGLRVHVDDIRNLLR